MWFARAAALFMLVFAAAFTCTSEISPYYLHHYQDQFPGAYHYAVRPNDVTAGGIRVDTSGLEVDLADLDAQTDAVEACLERQFGSPPFIPPDQVKLADCDGTTFPLPLIREDLVVKIAGDYMPSPCPDVNGVYEEVLPAPAPEVLCDMKTQQGLLLPCDEARGCHWRAGIEQNRYIVVTPNLYLYKDPLIRLVTGCNNPWVGQFAACAKL